MNDYRLPFYSDRWVDTTSNSGLQGNGVDDLLEQTGNDATNTIGENTEEHS